MEPIIHFTIHFKINSKTEWGSIPLSGTEKDAISMSSKFVSGLRPVEYETVTDQGEIIAKGRGPKNE